MDASALVDAAALVSLLHGRCLRIACNSLSAHKDGLSSAARSLFKKGVINGRRKRLLTNLDIAFHVTRHINSVSVLNFANDFVKELDDGKANTEDLTMSTDKRIEEKLNAEPNIVAMPVVSSNEAAVPAVAANSLIPSEPHVIDFDDTPAPMMTALDVGPDFFEIATPTVTPRASSSASASAVVQPAVHSHDATLGDSCLVDAAPDRKKRKRMKTQLPPSEIGALRRELSKWSVSWSISDSIGVLRDKLKFAKEHAG
eukprot:gnl/MRDRNA2_/MRDRNA2_30429_c0_seq1.p1 gnl/MRDRNA2_/MRDRNA2_30429_c0~~gnl/MRDRNA2_/MRDRNA2_30429_c0_seq1.p1  ORF type:complete len:285 (+),score=57.64 gnl/MRDRNA2_/MRDRNA2_30429_c0_seq1:87-857(+)